MTTARKYLSCDDRRAMAAHRAQLAKLSRAWNRDAKAAHRAQRAKLVRLAVRGS